MSVNHLCTSEKGTKRRLAPHYVYQHTLTSDATRLILSSPFLRCKDDWRHCTLFVCHLQISNLHSFVYRTLSILLILSWCIIVHIISNHSVWSKINNTLKYSNRISKKTCIYMSMYVIISSVMISSWISRRYSHSKKKDKRKNIWASQASSQTVRSNLSATWFFQKKNYFWWSVFAFFWASIALRRRCGRFTCEIFNCSSVWLTFLSPSVDCDFSLNVLKNGWSVRYARELFQQGRPIVVFKISLKQEIGGSIANLEIFLKAVSFRCKRQ